MNKFIELETNDKGWPDNAIYSIGVFTTKADKTFSFYVGEAEIYDKRGWNYDNDVIDEYGKLQYSSRVIHIRFRGENVKKKLDLLDKNGYNPFETVDLKKFRRIIEKALIDIFNIPPKFNKRRDYFKQEELSAGLVLYILSRKYKVISECLDIMSKVEISDFDYKNRQFIIFDEDSEDTVKLKLDINKMSSEILDFIKQGKFLDQGGYQCTEPIIYKDDNILVVLNSPVPSGSVLCDRLWNTGIGGECIRLYKTSDGKYEIILNPSDRGLKVDIVSWFNKWKSLLPISSTVIEEIERELLIPSLL